jgi:hypothetical protein
MDGLLLILALIIGFGTGVGIDLFYVTKIKKSEKPNFGDLDGDGEAWTSKDQAIWMKERFTHNHPRKKKKD